MKSYLTQALKLINKRWLHKFKGTGIEDAKNMHLVGRTMDIYHLSMELW